VRSLLLDVTVTLARAGAGTALALVAGAPVGVWLGVRMRHAPHPLAERALDALRSIPPIAVYPLLLVLLGYGETARLFTVVFGATGLVALECAAAVARAPAARRDVLRAQGASARQQLAWVDAYEALPGIAVGARAALSVALVVVLVSEMLVGAEAGLGLRLVEATLRFDVGALLGAVALVGVAGAAANAALAGLARRALAWAGRADGVG